MTEDWADRKAKECGDKWDRSGLIFEDVVAQALRDAVSAECDRCLAIIDSYADCDPELVRAIKGEILGTPQDKPDICEMLRDAVSAERERCAKEMEQAGRDALKDHRIPRAFGEIFTAMAARLRNQHGE